MNTALEIVRERGAMLAGMTPDLKGVRYFFCTTQESVVVSAVIGKSLGMFREEEGITLILEEADAREHNFDLTLPMSRIVLKVFSALDGVGLTAAVAGALADHNIPCNMIAAYHHDNVFVPWQMAQAALVVLQDVQQSAAEPNR